MLALEVWVLSAPTVTASSCSGAMVVEDVECVMRQLGGSAMVVLVWDFGVVVVLIRWLSSGKLP